MRSPGPSKALPFFLVHQHHDLKLNQAFRVSAVGNELLFLYIGKAVSEESVKHVGVSFAAQGGVLGGLAGGVASHIQSKQLEEVKAALRNAENADERRLRQLVSSNSSSLMLKAADVLEGSFNPPTAEAILSASPYHSTLRITHRERGKMMFHLLTVDDYRKATQIINLLGKPFVDNTRHIRNLEDYRKKMKTAYGAYFLATLFAIFGSVFAVMAVVQYQMLSWPEASATITGMHIEDGSSFCPVLEFSFAAKDGKTYQGKESLKFESTRSDAEKALASYHSGQRYKICYNSNDPAQTKVDPSKSLSGSITALLWAFGLAIVAVIVGFGFKKGAES